MEEKSSGYTMADLESCMAAMHALWNRYISRDTRYLNVVHEKYMRGEHAQVASILPLPTLPGDNQPAVGNAPGDGITEL
jgi:hypothetical protein